MDRSGSRVARLLLGACVLAGLAGCGGSGRAARPPSAAPPSRLTLVAAVPASAVRVRLGGATASERAVTLDVLAGFGAASGIRLVRFDDSAPPDPTRPGERRAIDVRTRDASPLSSWRARTLAEAVIARLERSGEAIGWETVDRLGIRSHGQALDPAAAGAAAAAALAGAARAGLDARATLYGNGALLVTLRLDERGYLAPARTDWLHVADFFDRPLPGAALAVTAPNGDVTFVAGDGVCYSTCGMPPGPSPGTPLPASLAGPTRLTVAVGDQTPRGRRAFRRAADCGAGDATAPRRLCAAVIADRYALLPPQVSDTSCAGGPSVTVRVEGRLGGIPVRQEYGTCTDGTVARWLATLARLGLLPAGWRA